MKNISKLILLCAAAVGFALPAFGQVSLSLSPAKQNTIVGDTLTYSIIVAGLKGSADLPDISPALGSFDIMLDYDSSVLTYDSATFGNFLNVDASGDSQLDASTTGQVNLMDISSGTAAALEAAQTSSFSLGTVTFTLDQVQSTAITFDAQTSLGDENSNSLTFSTSNASAVPEPGTYAFAGMGIVALAALALRRKAGVKTA